MTIPAKRGGKREPLALTPENIRLVAEGIVDKKTQFQIGKEMGISPESVSRLVRTAEFKEIAKEVFQAKMATLAGEVTRVLQCALRDNNLEAVSLWLKAMGLSGQLKNGDGKGGDNNFTIILPGQAPVQIQTKPDIVMPKEEPSNE